MSTESKQNCQASQPLDEVDVFKQPSPSTSTIIDRKMVAPPLSYLHNPGEIIQVRELYEWGPLRSTYVNDQTGVIEEASKISVAKDICAGLKPIYLDRVDRSPNGIILPPSHSLRQLDSPHWSNAVTLAQITS